ncbi:hypothetical protein DERF_011795 [Dermatophagoides farinae]|uniref:GPI mannosyltransferase 2 n=1 Tax=Dermatophagoides farinae TaxID=6954 RepID=A0A922HXV8_DERFA|nr:hypothetical protein DERF_011795 [Dermatophagoides farinae]
MPWSNDNRKNYWSIIIKKCIQSRIQLTILAIIADLFIPDHMADAYHNELIYEHFNNSKQNGWLETIIIMAMKPFISWDGQYFITIANYGGYYNTDEQMLAFFPFYPLIIRIFASILSTILLVKLHWITCIIISAYIVNIICFCFSACLLFELSQHFFYHNHNNDDGHDDIMNIVKLFIYNPASIFFTACYTESLFTALTLAAFCCLYIGHNPFNASLLFAMSAFTRSNGFLSIGYIIFYQICHTWLEYMNHPWRKNSLKIFLILKNLFNTIIFVIMIMIPFFLYQYYAYKLFCNSESIHQPQWCNYSIPLSYQAIQAKYWNIGLLRYYQWKQLPNFLLAIPILFVILYSSYEYFYINFKFFLSTLVYRQQKNISMFIDCTQMKNSNNNNNNKDGKRKTINIIGSKQCLPFVLHSIFLATFCILFMHIQVSNRFLLSSNPWPYWAIFHLESMKRNNKLSSPSPSPTLFTQHLKITATMIRQIWFIGYFILGTIMFANFLPFT